MKCNHLCVINDGNRRWAGQKSQSCEQGYMAGAEKGLEFVDWCLKAGINHLSAFAVSQENMRKRPIREINWALNATLDFCKKIRKITGVGLHIFGDVITLPTTINKRLELIKLFEENGTLASQKLKVHIGVNYSGQAELATLLCAVQKDGIKVVSQKPRDFILSAQVPDIDLLIRTGGHCRISGFLPLQISYAELYFTDVLWPDFKRKHFDIALDWYNRQERHLGE